MLAGVLVLAGCRCANVENAAGRELGELEIDHHGALYPVKPYGPVRVDGVLWRSSRLDSLPRYRQVAALGIRGVLDLRAEGLHDADYGAHEVGLATYILPIVDDSVTVADGPIRRPLIFEDVDKAFRWVEAVGEVDGHCEAGIGRTNTIVACWRCYHDHKTSEWALVEAASFGPMLPDQRDFVVAYCAAH
jgi:hypothetical protein